MSTAPLGDIAKPTKSIAKRHTHMHKRDQSIRANAADFLADQATEGKQDGTFITRRPFALDCQGFTPLFRTDLASFQMC